MDEVTFYRKQQNNLNLRDKETTTWYEYFLTEENHGKPYVTDLGYIYSVEEGMYGTNSEDDKAYGYCTGWIKLSFEELEEKMIEHYEELNECKVVEVIEI
jgi:hypothetical protein